MKRGFLRGKAIFQIFLLIVAFVYFSHVMKPVEAQDDVCCEKTLSGDYCFYGDFSNCDPAYQHASVSCEQTSFCKIGCCYDMDEGRCYKSVPKSTCINYEGGEWYEDETCEDVSTCQPGCCVIGSQCMFTTEQSCALETAEYSELEMIFHSDIFTESECLGICKAGEQGCCINTDDSCVYETREACDAAGGDFYTEQYCSNVALCGCAEQHSKACYDDDVYWFDSCGNREGIEDDCDYASGTICRVINEEPQCSSVNCGDTYQDTKNKHDNRMGGSRKNGESWCVYESPAGEALDRPGSRHYRHMCVSGEEVVESCRDYREEICAQGETDGFVESQCLYNDIYDSPLTPQVSSVPKGQRFWEDQGKCAEANVDCPVVWYKDNSWSDWECEENCDCETADFLKQEAEYCKFMGDCGADFNVVGEFTHDGYTLTGYGREGPPSTLSDEQKAKWNNYGVFGGMIGLYETISEHMAALIAAGGEAEEDMEDYQSDVEMYGMTLMAVTAVGAYAALAYAIPGKLTLSVLLTGTAMPIITLAILILILIYYLFFTGDTKTYHVMTSCAAWVAPTGGDNCEECLDQKKVDELGFYDSCTEYKCKSLGLNCEFIPENAGTERVACFNANPNDVNSPIISPWEEALTTGFRIEEIDQGYEIKDDVPFYEKISFGIETNELSQCKVSQEHTDSYEEMTSYFGDSYYQREHNMTVNPQIGGEVYDYYVRCQDGSGNSNAAEYVIRFTTDNEPDKTAPNVEGTSIEDYAYVPVGVNETGLTLYINEPANCKWSFTDQKYDSMEYESKCENEPTNALEYETYPCYTLLNITEDFNTYYFRCEDKSEYLNQNQQSYEFHLTSTEELVITSQGPEGILYDTTSPTLTVTTDGGAENGAATCYYTDDKTIDVSLWPEFFETGSTSHSQDLLNLAQGEHNYYILCKDIAPNEANTTITFTIDKDTIPPEIEYIYIDSEMLHVILNEEATCEYNNETFDYGEGTMMSGAGTTHHTAPVGQPQYYINCEDRYENHWSSPIIVYL